MTLVISFICKGRPSAPFAISNRKRLKNTGLTTCCIHPYLGLTCLVYIVSCCCLSVSWTAFVCALQKYEMIKTEEIPNLENSNFSTKVIKDIAQNILSFLKSNCTKEGHTYWLFKGKLMLECTVVVWVRAVAWGRLFLFSASSSDIVKLYDLTTLCEETEDKYQNPFTMPVAILLYKWVLTELRCQSNMVITGKLREKYHSFRPTRAM